MTDDRIQLFGFAPSTFVRTARMACVEKGIAHDLKPLEFRQPSHTALHPYQRMPAMRFRDLLLFETIAIAVFVDEAFDGPKLQPQEAAERARMHQWVSALCSYAFGDLVAALLVADADKTQAAVRAARHLRVLDDLLQTLPFLAGSRMTIADLFLAPMLAFAQASLGEHVFEDYSGVARWRDRMWTRASFRETAA